MAEKLEGFDSAPQRLEMCKLQVDDLQKVTTLSSPPISPLSFCVPWWIFWPFRFDSNDDFNFAMRSFSSTCSVLTTAIFSSYACRISFDAGTAPNSCLKLVSFPWSLRSRSSVFRFKFFCEDAITARTLTFWMNYRHTDTCESQKNGIESQKVGIESQKVEIEQRYRQLYV